jgi:hypothetical protein
MLSVQGTSLAQKDACYMNGALLAGSEVSTERRAHFPEAQGLCSSGSVP